jgi:glycosyltransferase involved in cell wall biosynthesis
MLPTVSVIIPVFNGKEYIEGLFDQLKLQTYRNIEVLFIDDGSMDGSADVIDELISKYAADSNAYEKDDETVSEGISFRLVSQANKGQGGARNRGVEEAVGKYIAFMDQDDHIKEDYICSLLDVAVKNSSDIVISGYEHVTFQGDVKEHVELVNNEWCRFMNITPWGKLYLRDFIISEGIRFLPVPLGEDIYFNVQCYLHARTVSYTSYVGYKWTINDESVSNTVHKRVNDETSVIRLYGALAGIDNPKEWMQDSQYGYFLIKTGIFHILYEAKSTPIKEVLQYRHDIFA